MIKNNWVWHNAFMGWFEGKLLTFTNWFWRKRHEIPQQRQETPQQPSQPQEKTSSKPKTKRVPAKKAVKKADWNVKQ